MSIRLTVLASALAVALGASAAAADTLSVRSLDAGPWDATIAALQRDVTAQGRAVRIVVADGARAVPCGLYALALDDAGQRAFAVEACDPATHATTLRLVQRSALFEPGDPVSRPRQIAIYATEVRVGSARGGAAAAGGSEVACSVAVRPYLDDLEHGGRVFLAPGRYALRPVAAQITADAAPGGWILRGSGRVGLTVTYDVLDTQRGDVVLHQSAELVCGNAPAAAPPPAYVSVAAQPPPCAPGACALRNVGSGIEMQFQTGVSSLALADAYFAGSGISSDGHRTPVHASGRGRDFGLVTPATWTFQVVPTGFLLARHLTLSPFVALGFGGRDAPVSSAVQARSGEPDGYFGYVRGGADLSLVFRWPDVALRVGSQLGLQHAWIGLPSLETAATCSTDECHPGASSTSLFVQPRVAVEYIVARRVSVGVFAGMDAYPFGGFAGGIYVGAHSLGWEVGTNVGEPDAALYADIANPPRR